jgi:hypothetical protein
VKQRHWFSGFTCEEAFTKETQRGRAATKTRNISRKGAKVAKKKMIPNLAFLASWRENNPKRP